MYSTAMVTASRDAPSSTGFQPAEEPAILLSSSQRLLLI